jgi:transposase InsO family protein
MQVPALEARRICELRERTGWGPRLLAEQAGRHHSTVHRVLQRAGCSRRPVAEREAVVRYEWPCPGQLLHMDVKKFAGFTEPGHKTTGDRSQRSRRPGWEYVHSMIDDYSRLAYSEICEDERAETVVAFTERALDFYLEHGIVAERLMTDNHMSYRRSHSFARLLTSRQIQHIRTRPYTPRTNGKVERFQQTLAREWAYAMQYTSSAARREALPHWLNHYNEQRRHSAIGNQPPLTRVRNLLGHNI